MHGVDLCDWTSEADASLIGCLRLAVMADPFLPSLMPARDRTGQDEKKKEEGVLSWNLIYDAALFSSLSGIETAAWFALRVQPASQPCGRFPRFSTAQSSWSHGHHRRGSWTSPTACYCTASCDDADSDSHTAMSSLGGRLDSRHAGPQP
jgi:hypothetical protein